MIRPEAAKALARNLLPHESDLLIELAASLIVRAVQIDELEAAQERSNVIQLRPQERA